MAADTPAPYVSGTVTITAGAAVNLYNLVLAQLDPNCPGAGHVSFFYGDTLNSNAHTIKFGYLSPIKGDVSDTNYGFEIGPGASKNYFASILGANAPLSRIRVFVSTTNATLHVEILA